MKTQITGTGSFYDPKLEEMILKRDTELKELARKNAKHFAKRNLPAAIGDHLLHYLGEIKAGYEKLAADVFHYLQPASHPTEAKADADYFREKDKNLETQIKEKVAQNHNDQYELDNFDQEDIPTRVFWTLLATLLITIGEIVFNTKAFQVTGESLLFSLVLSICVSFAALIYSHVAPMLYKQAKKKWERQLVIAGSLFLVISLFIALAIFRSSYLATHDVHIKPFWFVIINLFFFIVSALLSFFILPTWPEIKQNALRLKKHYAIKKRNKEIIQIKAEREDIKTTILERTKHRIRVANYANYAAERIRKMYKEAWAIFKTTNITFRTDGITPDCFSEEPPEPDIDDFNFTIINVK